MARSVRSLHSLSCGVDPPHSRSEPLAYTNLCTPRATGVGVHENVGSRHGLVSVGELFPEQSSQDATLAEERGAAFPRCWRTMPTVHEEILNSDSWKIAGLLQE